MKKLCDGKGIAWLEPGNPETLTVCEGCRICRDATRRDLENSQPFSEEEKKALLSGDFPAKDLNISLRKLMICSRQANANYVKFLKSCLTVARVSEMLSLSKKQVIKKLESNPQELLGLRFRSHWLLPKNQFHRGRLIPNFEKVLAVCYKPTDHALDISSWFGILNVDLRINGLEVTPRHWLISGFPPELICALAEYLNI